MGEECRIVTNKTPDAQQVINAFRSSACRWIVAVGMISEGTDIPRVTATAGQIQSLTVSQAYFGLSREATLVPVA